MDELIRLAAFQWLEEQVISYGEVLPRKILENGFLFRNQKITLVGPQGIWKPKIMDLPISITTVINGPYNDSFDSGLLKYRYRGEDPKHRDNVGLRTLMNKRIPLIYFHSILKGRYMSTWPVFIQSDDPENLAFTVAVESHELAFSKEELSKVEQDQETYGRRLYLTTTVRQRLHQRSFRERVLRAYKSQCSLCRLRHDELLDAAHIIPDKEDKGEPLVINGLSLCKIHHAAFDKNIIGITADYIVNVRKDILDEIDGPMLKYGIQSLENSKLILPSKKIDWPDQERLEIRYEKFLKAG